MCIYIYIYIYKCVSIPLCIQVAPSMCVAVFSFFAFWAATFRLWGLTWCVLHFCVSKQWCGCQPLGFYCDAVWLCMGAVSSQWVRVSAGSGLGEKSLATPRDQMLVHSALDPILYQLCTSLPQRRMLDRSLILRCITRVELGTSNRSLKWVCITSSRVYLHITCVYICQ